jgi:pyruvate/2-oxoglutarate dehydrogenase complex dihydrolipoamide acyltransferase (E2) component
MPRPKFPNKKTNGAEAPASAASAPTPKANGGAAETARVAASPDPNHEVRKMEMKTAAAKKTRKPEIVKGESRSNLVPINVEDEVRRLAYLLSERRGFEPGHETEDWLSAEREVLDRYHQHSA